MSWVETVEKVVLSAEPTESTEATITIEMPAAMRPYSIAVAPDSSLRNAKTFDIGRNAGEPAVEHAADHTRPRSHPARPLDAKKLDT